MKLLVAYATTEGQARKTARHLTERAHGAGHTVEMLALADADGVNPSGFDGVVLAASIHASQYQSALGDFAAREAEALNRVPTLFVSVSLAAAGHSAEEWRSLDRILADFTKATGWTPGQVEQVAGAYRPGQYDIIRRFIMRQIISDRDPDADPGQDKEYTDWDALDTAFDAWLASLSG
ncbi:flavodoxin domain-containing protein [Jannaschia aquimarina]|uniref:HemG protein n=1 Tax=Jannaschia aquimarina TaxID=935700 RepID=A0A0D1CSQ1_9RHOB|nr:flavodoxin domain-containing protein [Jannaschia aquimarina]KIT17782.1 Protoporphyrinogen IX dehydrogenase [Jannaschia aquimarina]SNT14434.1 menaquinone-dependent protoporphyrinogen oxidase [Jannaschia aquimarina]